MCTMVLYLRKIIFIIFTHYYYYYINNNNNNNKIYIYTVYMYVATYIYLCNLLKELNYLRTKNGGFSFRYK